MLALSTAQELTRPKSAISINLNTFYFSNIFSQNLNFQIKILSVLHILSMLHHKSLSNPVKTGCSHQSSKPWMLESVSTPLVRTTFSPHVLEISQENICIFRISQGSWCLANINLTMVFFLQINATHFILMIINGSRIVKKELNLFKHQWKLRTTATSFFFHVLIKCKTFTRSCSVTVVPLLDIRCLGFRLDL